MVATHNAGRVEAGVTLDARTVHAEVFDRRSDAVDLFNGLPETQREQLVVDAWSIGLRALRNAHAQAQEARLSDVGAGLLADLDGQLKAHVDAQQSTPGFPFCLSRMAPLDTRPPPSARNSVRRTSVQLQRLSLSPR